MATSDVQRKLTAIMCADVVGYSRLMGANEKATLRTLTDYQQVFADYVEMFRGRIVNSPGDSILAEFASVVDAVEGAAEIQRELAERNAEMLEDRQMLFRIGVNHGDVMVRGEELYGDAVNIAARLESLAEPGGICISRPVYDQVKQKLKLHFEYMGEQQVKNIAEAVRAYQVLTKPGDAAHRVVQEKSKMIGLDDAAIAATILQGNPPPLPELPSIAILAFDNISGDPEQDYFSEGLSEDIITDLSKLSGLFVISGISSFTYKGREVTPQQIGREMGVKFVLRGSFRKSGERVRITAQLIETEKGNHIWAERYDRKIEDVFVLQDEITEKIVTELDITLVSGEQARLWRKSLKDPQARENYYRGLAIANQYVPGELANASKYFQEVIRLEPKSPLGYTGEARINWGNALLRLTPEFDSQVNELEKNAIRALELDEQFGESYSWLAYAKLLRRKYKESISISERSLQLSPHHANVIQSAGHVHIYAGYPRKGIELINRAIRISPIFPAFFLGNMGTAYCMLGEFEEAINVSRKALEIQPNHIGGHWSLFHALAETNQWEEARHYFAKATRILGFERLLQVHSSLPINNPEYLNRLLDVLVKLKTK